MDKKGFTSVLGMSVCTNWAYSYFNDMLLVDIVFLGWILHYSTYSHSVYLGIIKDI
jgi:hypothetical protein